MLSNNSKVGTKRLPETTDINLNKSKYSKNVQSDGDQLIHHDITNNALRSLEIELHGKLNTYKSPDGSLDKVAFTLFKLCDYSKKINSYTNIIIPDNIKILTQNTINQLSSLVKKEDAKIQFSKIPDKTKAFFLYNLGHISESVSDFYIDSAIIQQLISFFSNPNNKEICNFFYGLGLLAKHGNLNGRIPVEVLLSLMAQLKHASAQDVNTIIYSLGLLAMNGNLSGHIPVDDLFSLLDEVTHEKFEAKYIADIIYDFGLIAKAESLSGQIETDALLSLVAQLKNKKPSDRDIHNTIYGLGLLGKYGSLNKPIYSQVLSNLISYMSNPNAKEILDTIISCCYLAEAGKISEIKAFTNDFRLLINKLAVLINTYANLINSPSMATAITKTILHVGISQNHLEAALDMRP